MPEKPLVDRLIDLAMEEDVGPGDWTTQWTVKSEAMGRAVIVAKEPLVVSGTEVASRVFKKVDDRLRIEILARDGESVQTGDVILEIRGPVRGILTGERVALNFLGHLSGVATLTRAFVQAVEGTGTRILDTRKTMPGWRALEKHAVRSGGGENHRHGLHDMILVKDNHLVAAGGVQEAVKGIESQNQGELEVEVEVTTLDELEELLPLYVDRILLDNMDLATMREAVILARTLGAEAPKLEASGNMTLDRVRAVAGTGVDFISVGALTHSARQADLSLRVLEGLRK